MNRSRPIPILGVDDAASSHYLSNRGNVSLPEPTFFATPADFRDWLERHHASAHELWVGFHKKGSGRPSITWPESVDEALCFGWIDGVRRSIDADSYMIRFSPRKSRSTWSEVNTRRARELIEMGLMKPAGRSAFDARDPERTREYSYERRSSAELAEADQARFRANRPAWEFFEAQPPGYRRTALWWVMSAKREPTRQRRLQQLIEDCEAGRRIGLLRRAGEGE